jgi:hypothetical protein
MSVQILCHRYKFLCQRMNVAISVKSLLKFVSRYINWFIYYVDPGASLSR